MEPNGERKSVREEIYKWLEKAGYPLEQQAEAVLSGEGFLVDRGRYYHDEAKGEHRRREIDVVATTSRLQRLDHPKIDAQAMEITFVLALFIECKRTKKPWVAFTSDRGSFPEAGALVQSVASALGEFAIYSLDRAGGSICALRDNHLFRWHDRSGYSAIIALKDDPDELDRVYQALHAATTAAYSLRYDDPPIPKLPEVCSVGFPVVVTDAPLFECWYDHDADGMQLEERSRIRLYWHGASFHDSPVQVDIVRADALQAYAREMMEGWDALIAQIEAALPAWMAELHQGGIGYLNTALYQFRHEQR